MVKVMFTIALSFSAAETKIINQDYIQGNYKQVAKFLPFDELLVTGDVSCDIFINEDGNKKFLFNTQLHPIHVEDVAIRSFKVTSSGAGALYLTVFKKLSEPVERKEAKR